MFEVIAKFWYMLATILDAGTKVATSIDNGAAILEDFSQAERDERKLKHEQRIADIRARASQPVKPKSKQSDLEL
jgi:hypothetical protein